MRLKFAVSLFLLLFVACQKSKNTIDIKLQKVATYGKLDGHDNEIFGRIMDYCFNSQNDLYVLDSDYLNVKVYDTQGNWLKTIGGVSGQGPGEFVSPMAITMDTLNNLYVSDRDRNDITVFDATGTLVQISRCYRMTCIIKSQNPFEVYGLAHPMVHRNKLIQKYRLLEGAQPEVSSFCDRQHGQDSLAIVQSGFFGDLAISEKDEVVYAFPYPYEIRVFNGQEQRQKTLKRHVEFFRPPVHKEDYYVVNTGIRQIIPYSIGKFKNLLICKYYKMKYGQLGVYTSYFFDFWDIDTERLLGTFTDKDLSLKDSDWIRVDHEGFLYASYTEPFPHISKYRVVFTEN